MRRAITMCLIFTACGWAQDSLAEMLRRGVEVESRNLPAAMENYKKVVAQFDEGRKTAATALFRMAECYRKQRDDVAAQAAYRRLIEQFGDQAVLVRQARKQLTSNHVTEVSNADREAARQRYRAALEGEIKIAQMNFDFVKKQVDLGAVSEEDLLPARQLKLKAEKELAAFDLGMTPAGQPKK